MKSPKNRAFLFFSSDKYNFENLLGGFGANEKQ